MESDTRRSGQRSRIRGENQTIRVVGAAGVQDGSACLEDAIAGRKQELLRRHRDLCLLCHTRTDNRGTGTLIPLRHPCEELGVTTLGTLERLSAHHLCIRRNVAVEHQELLNSLAGRITGDKLTVQERITTRKPCKTCAIDDKRHVNHKELAF